MLGRFGSQAQSIYDKGFKKNYFVLGHFSSTNNGKNWIYYNNAI
jgi:hypothetical protein